MKLIANAKHLRHRLKARLVNVGEVSEEAKSSAETNDDWGYAVSHGGGVAVSYGWRAETECVLAVSNPAGLVVVWLTRDSANSITYRRAANACIQGAGDLWDSRITNEERLQLAKKIMQKAFEKEVTVLDQIAAVGHD